MVKHSFQYFFHNKNNFYYMYLANNLVIKNPPRGRNTFYILMPN